MKIKYDPEVDVMRITFKEAEIEESDEETPGIITDFDADGSAIGIEILQASKRIDNPQAIEYLSSEKVQFPIGAVMRLPATWQDYQALSQQRGDQAIPRIKYRTGEVLLMSPLPEHARNAHLIANVVTVLLDHAGRDYEAFTPVTMELPEKSGIEPDYCFYLNNWQAVAGKKRIDWSVNPPPDLVLEVDVTSYTNVNDYLPYRVPEVWLLRGDQVVIYCLHNEEYSPQTSSQYFPDVNVQTVVAECLHAAYERNTSAALRELRQSLVSSINQR